MNRHLYVLVMLGVVALGWLTAPGRVASTAAEPAAAGDMTTPPGITKGVSVDYFQPGYPVYKNDYKDPIVEEVRGRWVRLHWVDNDNRRQRTFWVNFDTVNAYRISSPSDTKAAGERKAVPAEKK